MSEQERMKLPEWGLLPVRNNGPVCIAGPCAAESPEQVMNTARALAALHVSAFRAGVWKPRTRPGRFEGAGEDALQWLRDARTETGLKIVTEAANARHVQAALNAGVDIIWLGARTTANPFAVQEVADALRGTDIPVFIKNPPSPDINLWTGAVERIMRAGISRVATILRGFTAFVPGELRNEPGWQIAIDMQQRFPMLPMLCDPSHIAGRRDRILQLSQEALNLDFDGLLLEAHCNPEMALSDAKQQLSLNQLADILQSLRVRQRGSPEGNNARLNALRSQIDELDAEILAAVAKRMDVVRSIGELKKAGNMTVLQPDRWKEVLNSMRTRARQLGLDVSLAETLAKLLHGQAIAEQQNMLRH